MAQADISVVTEQQLPVIVELYNQVFRPPEGEEYFRRRFQGRYNVLMLVASMDNSPVGFFVGFELKPNMFFAWLYGVMPDQRRQGIASQLIEAVHSWASEHGYDAIRFECHNQHRPMLHLAIAQNYDIVGIRWDPDRNENLVLFEKSLVNVKE